MNRTDVESGGVAVAGSPVSGPVAPPPPESPPAAPPCRRLQSIDFLRGVAVLAVLLVHAIDYNHHPPAAHPLAAGWPSLLCDVLHLGELGVPLFFVISGFCIHLKWARDASRTGRQARLHFGAFWRRRLWRLYPAYFTALCLSMSLVLLAYLLGANVPLVTRYPPPRLQWMALDFLCHVPMLHGFSPLFDRMGGNPPFWTLAREEYFYLLYFVLLPWRRRLGVGWAALTVLVLGLAFPQLLRLCLAADSAYWPVIYSSAVVLWFQWCLGMVAAEAYCGLIELPAPCAQPLLVPLWAAAAFAMLQLQLAPLFGVCMGVAFFTLLNFCLALEAGGCWPASPLTSWLVGVGTISYSIYLVHNPTCGVLKQMLGAWARTREPAAYLVFAGLLAAGGYWAGKLFFWLVERHCTAGPAPDRAAALGRVAALRAAAACAL